jgi:hypothetical protein
MMTVLLQAAISGIGVAHAATTPPSIDAAQYRECQEERSGDQQSYAERHTRRLCCAINLPLQRA